MKSVKGFTRILLFVLELSMFFLVYYAMTKDVGISKAFTWHPILMTFGFTVCMNEGLIMYYFGDLAKESRHDTRKKHGVLQLLSIFCYTIKIIICKESIFYKIRTSTCAKIIRRSHSAIIIPPPIPLSASASSIRIESYHHTRCDVYSSTIKNGWWRRAGGPKGGSLRQHRR